MRKILLFVTVATSYAASAGVVKCGPGEVLDECPSNCIESCPTRDGDVHFCRRIKWSDCPPPKCICDFNHHRAPNGKCIPTRQCPAFECSRPNEVYNPCPFNCPTDDCSQATENGECPYPGLNLVILECVPACRCKPTFWRKDGVCVPYHKCDKKYDRFRQLFSHLNDPGHTVLGYPYPDFQKWKL